MIYSFLICTSILRNANEIIDDASWNFFLRGAGVFDKTNQPENPLPEILKQDEWDLAYALELKYPDKFENFCDSFIKKRASWENYANAHDPLEARVP